VALHRLEKGSLKAQRFSSNANFGVRVDGERAAVMGFHPPLDLRWVRNQAVMSA
jgi:hypothetical protein